MSCRLWWNWSTRTLRSPRHGDRRSIRWRGTVPLTILRTLLVTMDVGYVSPWIVCTISPHVGTTAVSDWAGDKYSLSVQQRLMRWSVPRVGAPTAARCSWRHRDGTLGPRIGECECWGTWWADVRLATPQQPVLRPTCVAGRVIADPPVTRRTRRLVTVLSPTLVSARDRRVVTMDGWQSHPLLGGLAGTSPISI